MSTQLLLLNQQTIHKPSLRVCCYLTKQETIRVRCPKRRGGSLFPRTFSKNSLQHLMRCKPPAYSHTSIYFMVLKFTSVCEYECFLCFVWYILSTTHRGTFLIISYELIWLFVPTNKCVSYKKKIYDFLII